MRTLVLLTSCLVLVVGLCACGQKGPLYLPEATPAEKSAG
jgi:predicted small lipoprotein YifL